MKDYGGEQVLVIKRALFDRLGSFQGAQAEVAPYLETILSEGQTFFLDRNAAEEDPTHKQLIPYCIFKFQDTILHYLRGASGGESRLHAKGSIGVGGHINPVDGHSDGGEATYRAAVARELDEELLINAEYSDHIIGLINDDTNEVGQVHLGVVHLIELTSDQVSSREDCLVDLKFIPVSQLKGELYDDLESWSQLALTLV